MNAQLDDVADMIRVAGVHALLAQRPAIVVERVPRGGGRTRWYWIEDVGDLQRLSGLLLAGSVVSFYFDERIRRGALNDASEAAIMDLVAQYGDAVVAWHAEGGIELQADFVAGANELSELLADLASVDQVFFGAFPARDNDGTDAVTFVLPDADGVVRLHPH